ncbi:hypothetical protein [Thermomonas sp.]|uniref:hypothetical protein n=1 Tax=Thermomonas sp. TaxID=1971895 RepID=UPI0024872DBA|nr:hypothetical protein [Thermomonas sp.]MDI1252277.1 hypothetical protein [Thermomonas sp.]
MAIAMPKVAVRLLVAAVLCAAMALALPYVSPWPVSDTATGILYGFAASCFFAGLLRWRMPEACDTGTPALRSRYLREFMPAMAGYVVTLFLSVWLLKRGVDEPGLRALVALLPVPAIGMALRAIIRYIRDVDELQQRIELEAVSFAAAFVSMVYIAGGFLQLAKVIDIPSGVAMIWVFPMICASYGLAKMVVSRRFQ